MSGIENEFLMCGWALFLFFEGGAQYFSFVISFEISKLTSSFVNFNNLTKLIYGKKIGAQYFSQSLRTKSFGSSFEIEKICRKLRP